MDRVGTLEDCSMIDFAFQLIFDRLSSRFYGNSLQYLSGMLEDLHIAREYDGFIFLADATKNPPVLRPHRHVELELNLVVSGTITYVLGKRRFTFGKGTLLWLFPSQRHQLVDRSPEAQYFVSVFKPEMIREACHGTRYEAMSHPEIGDEEVLSSTLEKDAFEQIQQSMHALLDDGLDAEVLNREAGFGVNDDFSFQHGDPDWLNAGLRHLLLLCWRLQSNPGRRQGEEQLHPSVRKALDLLGRFDELPSLEELAQQCGVSPAYLSRTFRRQVGLTLARYRNSLKLSRFWEHYRGPSQLTMMEAAFEAGFGSYAQFFRVFQDAYGAGPRETLKRA